MAMILTMTKKPNQKQSTSSSKSGEVGNLLRECDLTSRNIELHNSIRKKSNQIILIW